MPPTHRTHDSQADADDCRCLCGSLLARVIDGVVELKCRRCKRTLRVPLDAASQGPVGLEANSDRRAV